MEQGKREIELPSLREGIKGLRSLIKEGLIQRGERPRLEEGEREEFSLIARGS